MLKFDWNILWTVINLIILFLLMKKFLFKPIKKTLDKRQELIDNRFKEADEKEKNAEELYEQYRSQLDGAGEERGEIIAKARSDAKKEYDKIVGKAQTDADKIRADAKKSADAETAKARRAVKEEIAALAMDTAQKVIGAQASAATDSELYDKFLNESSGSDD